MSDQINMGDTECHKVVSFFFFELFAVSDLPLAPVVLHPCQITHVRAGGEIHLKTSST